MISRPFLRGAFCVVALAFAWIALSPQAQAVCQQDCDIINANTFLGDNALSTTGSANTAVGAAALVSTTAAATRPPVLLHSKTIPPAAPTRLTE